MNSLKKYFLPIVALVVLITACSKDPEIRTVIETVTETVTVTETDTIVEQSTDAIKKGIQSNYANIVYANYEDALFGAQDLKVAIDALVANPSESTLEAAKQAWFASREPYGQTEAFRFASGPIDAEDGPEGLLNAWPLDESYIDYIDGNISAGIINDLATYPTLDKELLASLNEQGGEENISIGYHAIEFLLWGQDLTTPSALQSGNRSFTDFTTAPNADRRKENLSITMDLLIEHLESMVNAWKPDESDNYRSEFLALSSDDAITNILTGIGTLAKSELAGERIFTAYDNKDQEDEHSCFSDNTHRDTRLNAIGVRNVFAGCYIRTDGISKIAGPSLIDLMDVIDPAFNAQVNAAMNEALSAVEATAIPFDFAISDDSTRPAVLNAVNKLRTFGDQLVEVGAKLGLTINTELE
jgi:putative iron-regulated protein